MILLYNVSHYQYVNIIISNQELANQFAQDFINKIQMIRDNLNNYDKYHVDEAQHIPILGKFEPLMEDEVTKIIMGMVSKSWESDPVPTTLLKEILPQVTKPVTKIINTSLELGIFASQWQAALVKPLLKKMGLALVAPNYCPVSNLPFLSKVLERCVVNLFTAHCDANNLFPGYQSTYRRNYSCEMALIKMTNDCLWAMENQMVTALVAIDLSATFDTVDHEILLEVLNKKFGLQNTALHWFDNYLRPRSCKVAVHGVHSKECQLPFSVPQGSVPGPVLYNAYASMLQKVVKSPITIHRFTDDHAIKDTFMPDNIIEAESNVIRSLKSCITSIKQWMDENRLQMNSAKIDFIYIGSRQQLVKCKTNSIIANGEIILRSSSIKYLGALIGERLSSKQFITSKCKMAMWNLQKLKAIRSVLTDDACKTVLSTSQTPTESQQKAKPQQKANKKPNPSTVKFIEGARIVIPYIKGLSEQYRHTLAKIQS